MRGMLSVLFFTLLTALCWGVYGPVLHHGQQDMGGSSLRPFVCVGLAYFVIAVIVPLVLLWLRRNRRVGPRSGRDLEPRWQRRRSLGALGVILAIHFHGRNPIYVMPLVFGCAPVVNTFVTMGMGKTYRQAGPLFYAGLILVITGAVTVLLFKPGTGEVKGLSLDDLIKVAISIAVVVVSWGIYGPLLHKGQVAMRGSRMRPLVCVGLAYFLIAVLGAGSMLGLEHGEFTVSGSIWSLAGGAAGAIGALGIIMAFTFGGKPVYVMPLVFGGASGHQYLYDHDSGGELESGSPDLLRRFAVGRRRRCHSADLCSQRSAPCAAETGPSAGQILESTPAR